MTRIRCGAKLNLALAITARLPNGYHAIESVFAPIENPCDILEIDSAPPGEFHLRANVPIAGKNILETAWELFSSVSLTKPGVKLNLLKGIPQGAGLGGASSDAAAFLNWLNSALPQPLPRVTLLSTALATGADVPFFIDNVPAFATGKGETLEPLAELPAFWAVIVWPNISLSTASVFKEWDRLAERGLLLTKKAHTDKRNFCRHWSCGLHPGENSLEPAALSLCGALKKLKDELLATEAEIVGMSGSGSSFFGLYSDFRSCVLAQEKLSRKYSNIYLSKLGMESNDLFPNDTGA